jgi:ferritin-like protein
MARFHGTPTGNIPFTAEEETARDAEELAWEEIKPFRKWQESIQETDAGMPRYMEDLITANSDFTIPEKMKTRYDEKVALRATKP